MGDVVRLNVVQTDEYDCTVAVRDGKDSCICAYHAHAGGYITAVPSGVFVVAVPGDPYLV